jgi:uncharacterized protein YPO0396
MKKAQLEEIIDKLTTEAAQYRSEITNLKFLNDEAIKEAVSDVEDKLYEQWKGMNDKFLKRYIKELIQNGEINYGRLHDE